ncbi:DUF421 domain-containing protein [Spirosoma soli]|uniref:DUF421 domain-containing protein n=1 Tax=Spirosoma soli TaxID=1770529 RepID=A0ABW5MA86_9BACT
MQEPVQPFDWERMFIDQFPWLYLGEVAFRTLVMFSVLLLALKISGKRQIKQLSVFELVLVIGLGSAAGDPMFYHDVPLLSAVVVFIVMMGCYKLITRISDRNRTVREFLEGRPVYVIENGCILVKNFKQEDITQDELFTALRLAGIKQLGEVQTAILEPTGEVSVFPYPKTDIKAGLPVLPKALQEFSEEIEHSGTYACTNCGHIETLGVNDQPTCSNCTHQHWVKAMH